MSEDFPTIAEASSLIAAKKLSPVELTRACLGRIEKLDGTLHAFLHLAADRALADARAAEAAQMRGALTGPLHGIPIGLKDIYNTKDMPTTAHSRQLIGNIPAEDSVCTRRLAAAGTVLLGKLATHEFAFGGPSFDLPWPPARNPWNPDHFTGGSSSGTGAAVAAGLILGGMGSDTGGSIRLPGGALRHRRHQADLWARAAHRHPAARLLARSCGSDGLDGRGLRAAAAGDRRP